MKFDPLAWLADEQAAWRARGLAREPIVREGPQRGDRIEVAGETLLNFGSNDYLGLAADPRLAAAANAAVESIGWGSGASPLVTGRGTYHVRLERALAEFEGTEAALLFPTGFAANVGAVTALVSASDAVFSDAKNHASIIDGCRLSGARIHIYRHGDVEHLAELLSAERSARRMLIVTDSLFSMDGDLAPLPELTELAERHGAMLMVDEAHATGVFGERGRGVCEHFGVEERVPIRVGTLSKALGTAGGFVVGSKLLIERLLNRARPYVFSTAMPEALSAAGLAALEIVRDEPERRRGLLARATELRARLQAAGFRVGRSASQIVPIYLGDPATTMQAAAALREGGVFVPGIRPPSVPEGESLLRISLSAVHGPAEIERLLAALASYTMTSSSAAKNASV